MLRELALVFVVAGVVLAQGAPNGGPGNMDEGRPEMFGEPEMYGDDKEESMSQEDILQVLAGKKEEKDDEESDCDKDSSWKWVSGKLFH